MAGFAGCLLQGWAPIARPESCRAGAATAKRVACVAKGSFVSTLVKASQPTRFERSRSTVLLAGTALAAVGVFLLLPGSIASKTHLALHGICAQRPSHSLRIGGELLPMDARMTGIYIGAAVTAIWLVVAGAATYARVPPRRVVAILALFVGLLGADGFNALAFDLGLPHPYEPSNVLRLATGVLGGVALGVALTFLFAATMWARPDRARPLVNHPATLAVPLGIGCALGGLALSGLPVLYGPFALGLLVAAGGVFAMLAIIALALVSNRAWTYGSFLEMGAIACVGVVAAVGLMAALAGMRIGLETWFGLPLLT